MKDLCIEQEDSTENLALVGEILGSAGVNIEGLCLITYEGRSFIHFIVEDAETAQLVLEHEGIRIRDISEVFVINKDEKGVTGKPGSFGRSCRILGDNGIKINFALYYQGKIKKAFTQSEYLIKTWPRNMNYQDLNKMVRAVMARTNIEITEPSPDELVMARYDN